jgi:hypothetical protein
MLAVGKAPYFSFIQRLPKLLALNGGLAAVLFISTRWVNNGKISMLVLVALTLPLYVVGIFATGAVTKAEELWLRGQLKSIHLSLRNLTRFGG